MLRPALEFEKKEGDDDDIKSEARMCYAWIDIQLAGPGTIGFSFHALNVHTHTARSLYVCISRLSLSLS